MAYNPCDLLSNITINAECNIFEDYILTAGLLFTITQYIQGQRQLYNNYLLVLAGNWQQVYGTSGNIVKNLVIILRLIDFALLHLILLPNRLIYL